MKKFLMSVGVVGLLFANVNFDKPLPQKEADEIIKSSVIYPKLKQLKDAKISVVKKDHFYIINVSNDKGSGVFYITEDKKYLIIGNVIDNKTGKVLEANLPKNIEVIKKGVVFTYGEGKKDLYIVTDPECPFCRLMEKQIGEKLYKNYKIHIILWPLPFHKHAKDMSYYILAGKNDKERAQRFKETLNGSENWKKFKPKQEEIEKFNKELQNSQKAVQELNSQGTPSIYDSNFKQIKWTDLKKDIK